MVRFILDFDGTLVDSEEAWIKFFEEIAHVIKNNGSSLDHNNLFLIVEDEFDKRNIDFFDKNFPHETVIEEICKRSGVYFSNEIFNEYKRKLKVFLKFSLDLRKGIQNILQNKNHQIFIVSDCPKDFISRVLQDEDISVNRILTQEDFGTHDKKVLYKNALDEEGVNIILGDRLDKDIKPGNELKEEFPHARIITVWYPYHAKRLKWYKLKAERKPKNDLEKPDFIVNDETIGDFLKKLE